MRTSLHKREDRLVERLRDPEERRRGSDARAMSATSAARGGGRNLLHEALGHLRTEGETSSACARGSGATVTNRGDGRCAQRAARGAPSRSLPSAACYETHGRGARRSVAGSAQRGALAGAAAHSAFSEIALTIGWSAETSTKRRCETSWMPFSERLLRTQAQEGKRCRLQRDRHGKQRTPPCSRGTSSSCGGRAWESARGWRNSRVQGAQACNS